MAEVFVSYVSEDGAIAEKVSHALEMAGFSVWWDRHLHGGVGFRKEIDRQLGAAKVVVVLWSAASLDSEWVCDEAQQARDENKLLPLRLDSVQPPLGFRQTQSLDFRGWNGDPRAAAVAKLIASARHLLGSPSTAPPSGATPDIAAKRRRWTLPKARRLIATISVIAIGLGGVAYWRSTETAQRVLDATIAQARELVQLDQYGAAFTLMHSAVAKSSARIDPRLQELWAQVVVPGTPLATDAGATLSYQAYDAGENDWIVAGVTPIQTVIDLPKGVVRIRLEKPGFQTGEFAIANPGPSVKLTQREFLKDGFSIPDLPLALAPEGKVPSDMVLVPATNIPVYLIGWTPSLTGDFQREIPEFAIARYEVTNREFKEFVDAGGYKNPEYWDGLEFRDEGRILTRPEAIARFVDRTGRPGPASWELSSYHAGEAELPVGGISWYEAVAYARFRDLSLPTIHHWTRAAFAPYEGLFETAPAVSAASRYRADDPVAAHTALGPGPWGTFNTAGNAREWVWNSSSDLAVALGGGWADEPLGYQVMHTARPMDRSADLGLRLMKSFDAVPDELLAPISLPFDPAYIGRAPVSDDAFEAMRFQFTVGNRKPSNVRVEQFAESDTWTAEEVVLEFGSEWSCSLYIVRPRVSRGPLQPVLNGFASDAFGRPQPNRKVLENLRNSDIVVSGGRALVLPIWSGSYQRVWTRPTDAAGAADLTRRAALDWYQTATATLDYLATREDFDSEHVGYIGQSFGSVFIGPPVLALDARVRAAVLMASGIWMTPIHPMADAVNYAPRIHVPVLMINGRYDSVLPHELSQVRLFELLGTPAADKRQVLFDVSHFTFPHSQLAKEVNDWFDKYLGPVK